MNVLSLFDGMSCGRIALERAGIPVTNYYASEIDKYAITISKKNYPDIVQLGDVRYVEDFLLPEIDLLIGGSPCQGFSFAGKSLNFEDPKSVLFFEFVRLLKDCKPKYFLLENVIMRKEWQDVISDLVGVEPLRINSNLFSAQNRDRLYWTNIPIKNIEDQKISFSDIIDLNVKNYRKLTIKATERALTNPRSRIVDVNSDKIPPILFNQGKQATDSVTIKMEDGSVRWLTRNECERLQNVPDNYTSEVGVCAAISVLGNGWTVNAIAHIFKGLQ